MPPNAWSRHRFCTGLTDARGRRYLTEREPYTFRELPDTRVWVAGEGDTVEYIADRAYGGLDGAPGLPDPCLLWWVICDFQPDPPPDWAFDPTRLIPAGASVFVPSARVVREEILSERRRIEHDA